MPVDRGEEGTLPETFLLFFFLSRVAAAPGEGGITRLLLESFAPASLPAVTTMAGEGIACDRCLNITRNAFS